MIYHGISWSRIYRVGVALLDLDDPTIVIARGAVPVFEPTAPYELAAAMPVVFPCGVVVRGDTIFMYYGASDKTVGVATASLKELLRSLQTAS